MEATIKELTLEQIEQAFADTGLTPERNVTLSHVRNCACALGAVACHEGHPGESGVLAYFGMRQGFDVAYLVGVMHGWDGFGNGDILENQEAYRRGRTLGKQAWQVLSKRGH